jgi:hypothetical protein
MTWCSLLTFTDIAEEHCFLVSGCFVRSSTPKMELVLFCEMLINFYNTTRRHIAEDTIFLSYRCENLKFNFSILFSNNIFTCYLRSQPIQWFIARQQLCKRATSTGDVARQPPARNKGSTVGSGVFCVVRPEAISRHRQFRTSLSCELPVTVELSVLSAVASKQATRKGAPVQPVEKNNRTSDCDDCNCNGKGVGQ